MYKRYTPLILVLIFILACSKPVKQDDKTANLTLSIKNIEVKEQRDYPAYSVMGYHADDQEFYLHLRDETLEKHWVGIFDSESGEMKRDLKLLRGSGHQSPKICFVPGFMKRVDDRYFMADGFDKIMVFDGDFNHIESNMFHAIRYFMDFYEFNSKNYLFIGKTIYSDNDVLLKRIAEIYKMPAHNRPVRVKELSAASHKIAENPRGGNTWKVTVFQPAVLGFEKNGRLFWADTGQSYYHTYDLNTWEKTQYSLSYLGKKPINNEDAEKIWRYHYEYPTAKFRKKLKKRNRELLFVNSDDDIYHFGIYDVGKDKIGIIGDLDLDTFHFRMDVFSASGEYQESLMLPFGQKFIRSLRTSHTAAFFLDLDNRVYIYADKTATDEENIVRLIHF